MRETTSDPRPSRSAVAARSRNAGLTDGSAGRLKQVGRALRTAREWCGMAQGDAAAALGVSQSVVSGWETGNRSPSADQLLQLANLYGRDLGEFGRSLQGIEVMPGGTGPRTDQPPPSPEDLARLLLGRTSRELPVDNAEPALAAMLRHIYELAAHLRRHR